jgi:uncharacterized protein YciI
MIIVSLTYVMPIEAVEAQLDGHIAWLKEGYESGMLMASGRKVPRTGGVLLAKGISRTSRHSASGTPSLCTALPPTSSRRQPSR